MLIHMVAITNPGRTSKYAYFLITCTEISYLWYFEVEESGEQWRVSRIFYALFINR